jgi:lipopolysaccharide export system protein LptA
MMRTLIVLLLLALAIAFAAPRAYAESGDAVDVAPAEQSDTEAAESTEAAPAGDAEEVITSSADIPPDKLIEPPPERTSIENTPMPGITFKIKDFYQKLPTPEEWELVMAAILGLTPPPAMQPPPAKAPPSKEPVKPKGAVKKPEAKPEEKPEYEPLTTEEAVSLAMEIKAGDLTNDFARIVISQGRVSGNTSKKEYDVVGEMSLYYRDLAASSKRGHIEQETETVQLSESVVVEDPNYSLNAEELNIHFKDKSFDAKVFVKFRKLHMGKEPVGPNIPKRERVINIFKNEPTDVYSNLLSYNWDTEEMHAQGEVKVVQKYMSATMDSLDYSPDRKTYLMSGNVFITLLDTNWIFENQIVEKDDEDLARALTEKETTIEADTLETGEDSDVTVLKGNGEKQARLVQEDKELSADTITFNDKTKLMTAEGNAKFYQENGDWLRKGKLIDREPSAEAKRYMDNKVTSTSPSYTFDYDKRILHQWGGVEVDSGDEKLVADDLVYDEKGKVLTLTGNVGYFRGPDEYLVADKVIIDIGKNKFKFTGIIESFLFTTDESRKIAHPAPAPAEGEGAAGDGTAGTGGETAPPAEGGSSTPPGEATPPPPPPPTGGLSGG